MGSVARWASRETDPLEINFIPLGNRYILLSEGVAVLFLMTASRKSEEGSWGPQNPIYPPHQTRIRWVRFLGGNPFKFRGVEYSYGVTRRSRRASGRFSLDTKLTGGALKRVGGNPFAFFARVGVLMGQPESTFTQWAVFLVGVQGEPASAWG
jgi:hypothetical protein